MSDQGVVSSRGDVGVDRSQAQRTAENSPVRHKFLTMEVVRAAFDQDF